MQNYFAVAAYAVVLDIADAIMMQVHFPVNLYSIWNYKKHFIIFLIQFSDVIAIIEFVIALAVWSVR